MFKTQRQNNYSYGFYFETSGLLPACSGYDSMKTCPYQLVAIVLKADVHDAGDVLCGGVQVVPLHRGAHRHHLRVDGVLQHAKDNRKVNH